MATLADRLREAMKARAMEPRELAARAEITDKYVYFLLSGVRANPRLRVMRRLSAALGVPVQWLTEGTGDMAGAPYTVPLRGWVPSGGLGEVQESDGVAYVPDRIARERPDLVVVAREAFEGVEPGDLLFVRRQPWADGGNTVLVETPQGMALRRFERAAAGFYLEPGRIPFNPAKPGSTRLIGVVVGKRP